SSIVTRVLYVEDNDDNVFMLKMRLELPGDFEGLTAEDGGKGCAMEITGAPDIILMALEMPVAHGWESSRRLKGVPQTPAIRNPATSRSSACRRMRLPASAKRHSGRDATTPTPSRSNSIGWSQPFAAFLPIANDALMRGLPRPVTPGLLPAASRILPWFQVDGHRFRCGHPSDSEQLRSVPRTYSAFDGTVDPSTAPYR